MPKGLWTFDRGVWRGIIGDDIIVEPPPPPGEEVPPVFIGKGGMSATTGHSFVDWPAGHQVGDIAILLVETANQSVSLNIPAGFASIDIERGTGTAGDPASSLLAAYWCRATSTAMPSPRIADPGDHSIAVILLFRGCIATGNPYDVATGNVQTPADATVEVPGNTTTLDKCLVVAAVAHSLETAGNQLTAWANADLINPDTLAAGVKEVADIGSTAGNGGGIGAAVGIKNTAGLFGQTTATLLSSSLQGRMSIALKPSGTQAPPPATGFRKMVGVFGFPHSTIRPVSTWVSPWPDVVFSDSNGANWVESGGWIDQLRAAGSCCVAKVTGGGVESYRDPVTRRFSIQMWKDNWDAFMADLLSVAGGLQKFRDAVRDGVIRAILILDDYSTASSTHFSAAVTYDELETVCEYAKSTSTVGTMPWVPLVGRVVNTYHKQAATVFDIHQNRLIVRRYRWFDAGWAQYKPSSRNTDGAPGAYYAREVQNGIDCGLGLIGGINMLRRGNDDYPACSFGSDSPGTCVCTPDEIEEAGLAAIQTPGVHGFNGWAWTSITGSLGTTYITNSQIEAAWLVVYNAASGRDDPPVNIRGDLVAA